MAYRNISLVPAYGRDYKSKAAVLADWNANKDFLAQDLVLSGYINKAQVSDLRASGVTHLHFRYKNLAQVAVVAL